jgi:hypothetical protein
MESLPAIMAVTGSEDGEPLIETVIMALATESWVEILSEANSLLRLFFSSIVFHTILFSLFVLLCSCAQKSHDAFHPCVHHSGAHPLLVLCAAIFPPSSGRKSLQECDAETGETARLGCVQQEDGRDPQRMV